MLSDFVLYVMCQRLEKPVKSKSWLSHNNTTASMFSFEICSGPVLVIHIFFSEYPGLPDIKQICPAAMEASKKLDEVKLYYI